MLLYLECEKCVSAHSLMVTPDTVYLLASSLLLASQLLTGTQLT
jgi:hypothetical protein